MKRSFLLCTSFLLLSQSRISAQSAANDFKYSWSDDVVYTPDFLKGNDKDGYIHVGSYERNQITVRHFDNQLHHDAEFSFTPPDIAKEFTLHKLLNLGGKTYMLYSSFNKSEEKEKLFVQELDSKTGKLTGEVRLLASSDIKILPNYEGSNNWLFGKLPEKWWVFVSNDQSKIMIQYRLRPEHINDKVNSDKIGFIVLDAQLKELWSKVITMPYTESRMNNENYHVDNDGNAYVLAKIFPAGEGNKSPNFRFEILKYSKDADQVTKIPFSVSGKFANSVEIGETADNKVFVTGFYSSRSRMNSAEGFYLFKLNDLADTVGKTQKWMHAFGKDAMSTDKDDDEDSGPINLELHQVVTLPDGAIQLIGEERSSYVSQAPGSSAGHSSTYCNSLLVMQINKDGVVDWMTPIRKKQKSNGLQTDNLSFSSFHKNGNSYIFFMNNEDNLERSASARQKLYKGGQQGALECLKIDAKGTVAAPVIISAPFDGGGFSSIRNFAAVDDDKMIINSSDGRKGSKGAFLSFQ
ncbi:hypothetical protein DN068_00985 [Taibaiella soli]|uniref:Uncharacterized protein n=2 Tax=Taibaiella soli TaxID=1649169 RepID=A0A2W2C3V6_9BACT|nr:hypothetical protein DN068_00985 [Taibaiella soli]